MGVLQRFNFFEKAEVVLERKLYENPYYPFDEFSGDDTSGAIPVFVYSARLKWFYLSLLSTVAILLFIIVWPSANGDNEYLVFAVSGLAISIYCTVEFYSLRTILLDPSNEHYSVYRGRMLTASQHCHNIYIRLLCNKTGSRHPTYHLVLDGVGLEASIRLTRESTNKKKLRQLAQEVAARLHINYFDIHNSSKHHLVRHHRPDRRVQEFHEE